MERRKREPGPSGHGALGAGFVLRVVVVVVMVTVVAAGSKRGAGKHHQKQGCNNKLLHSQNRSMKLDKDNPPQGVIANRESRMERGCEVRRTRTFGFAGFGRKLNAR
jgi:hypothetical protein